MEKEKVQSLITDYFRKRVRADANIRNAYLLVHSDNLGIDLRIAEGSSGSIPANPNQPYYIASVSKLFASVLVGILVEKGMVSFEDYISLYVDPELLRGLHIYKGKDYTHDIKIKHLLNHTSGLNDFMEDKSKQGKNMVEMMFEEPSRSWTPQEVIQWSKEHLESHFPPGKGFHYSDTGYHLLGLIVEKITTKPYHEALRHYIFEPCEMHHSSFANYSEPIEKSEYPAAGLYGRNIDILQYRSNTIMFAGGGMISTTADQLKFMKALAHGEILSEDTFNKMKDWAKFFMGIDYGYGLMNIKTVPILMPQRYNAWGNAGSTGTFMFYHPATDTYIIGGLNHLRYSRKGIMLMLKTIDRLTKAKAI
ncbi:beta-lactamase [Cohnella kolymensis]|uniref:Beta-lactamase n=1 Tax=Cohnella kolymensis TaxID=1590652 RepID=A0ABR5A7W0_9BACL|nr:serine hydrolase domain-containing protein [Cohnella kolymensis]KIL37099.1 beta-lactamase [Cohnella kolymensis]